MSTGIKITEVSESFKMVEIESMLGRKFEPKRQCRWIISIEGIDPFLAKKTSRPAVRAESGKLVFNPINIELYDPIAPSAAQMAWAWLHESEPRDVTLQLLDPVGSIVEEWFVSQACLTAVDFGELDYASAEPATVKLTLTFTECELKF